MWSRIPERGHTVVEQASRQTIDRNAFPRHWIPGKLLALGIAMAVSIALLWGMREHFRVSPSAPSLHSQENARGSLALGTEVPFQAPALSAPGDNLPSPGDPAEIAQRVARLLSGTPDLDPQHLRAMIDRARDPARSLEDRVGAIRWLARFGDDEALDVLQRLLRSDSPSPIRASVVMALGESSHLSAARLLETLLDDENLEIALGAIRALANHDDPGTTEALESLAADTSVRNEIRSEALLALDRRNDGVDAWGDAFARSESAQQPSHQGEQDFRQTFRRRMEDPEVSVDAKLTAVEALAEGGEEEARLLLEVARDSEEIELRSAAIDALALSDEPGDAIAGLAALVADEPSPEIRADLYNTLAFHADHANGPGSEELVRSALAESMPRAQLEGYRMVASMLHREYEPEIAERFDSNMVAWLQDSAEQGGDRYTRHLAFDALKLAGTPGAHEALLDLSHSTDPSVSQVAEKALRLAAEAGTGTAYVP